MLYYKMSFIIRNHSYENESYLVESNVSHSVWNNINDETIMLGITLKERGCNEFK